MDTQSGARNALVDPFGRELEEWLRDAPATRTPYVADLVVPPVTGPIRRPTPADVGAEAVAVDDAADADVVETALESDAEAADSAAPVDRPESAPEEAPEASPVRVRVRDHGRHTSEAFARLPEPPTRCSLTFAELAVVVLDADARSSVERIELFEEQLRVQEADRARVVAWEASVVGQADAEVVAARAYMHEVFAELIAADSAAGAPSGGVDAPAVSAPTTPAPMPTRVSPTDAAVDADTMPIVLPTGSAAPTATEPTSRPIAAAPTPTPLVQPATGPNVIDRLAFEAAIKTHAGQTAEEPTAFPLTVDAVPQPEPVADARSSRRAAAEPPRASWWKTFVAGLLRAFGRR